MWSDWPIVDLIFLACAAIGALTFGVWLILQFLGGAAEASDLAIDTTHDVSGQADLGFTILSFQGLSSFLTIFGLVGLACHLENRMSTAAAVALATAAGASMSWLIHRLFRVFARLQSSGTIDMTSTQGHEGVIYLRVPAKGQGKVEITIQNRQMVVDCVAADQSAIETGVRVKVEAVVDGHLLSVRPTV